MKQIQVVVRTELRRADYSVSTGCFGIGGKLRRKSLLYPGHKPGTVVVLFCSVCGQLKVSCKPGALAKKYRESLVLWLHWLLLFEALPAVFKNFDFY